MMAERMDESPEVNWNREGSGSVCDGFVLRLGKITPVLIVPNGRMSCSLQILNRSSGSGHIRINFEVRLVGLMIRFAPITVFGRQKRRLTIFKYI
jgi:hypothetical protein